MTTDIATPVDTAAARRLASAFTAAPLTGDGADGWGCRRIGWALEEALDALDAARAEVARLREAMPDAHTLDMFAAAMPRDALPGDMDPEWLRAAAARIRALDVGVRAIMGDDDETVASGGEQ